MPLMIYSGKSNETRRTKEALARRAANAARRGWTFDRIQAQKAGDETRGGGEHSKGKGKHKGKGAHTHGHGESSDGQRKGGKGGARGGSYDFMSEEWTDRYDPMYEPPSWNNQWFTR